MSSLLRRRDPEQCRSHHQKLGLRFGSDLSKIIDHLKKKISKSLVLEKVGEFKDEKRERVCRKKAIK